MISDKFNLSGHTIVIVGGAGLLGKTFAKAVLEAGGSAVVLDISQTSLEECSNFTDKATRSRFLYLNCDITNEINVQNACNKVLDRFGGIDGLVNAASNNPAVSEKGLQSKGRLEDFDLTQWHRDIDIGLTGAFICSKVFGATMAETNGGVILNIASDLGIIAPDQRLYRNSNESFSSQSVKPVTYSVVKTGLIGLTRYLATYWPNAIVRANALAPGGVFNGQDENFVERLNDKIPMNRMANLDEYQAAVVFLLSRASSYMNGAVVPIDGGRTAW